MSSDDKQTNSLKKVVTPKRLMYVFNLVFILVLISLMTVANIIIDPEHFNFFTWMTNSLILVGIQIPCIILGELMGKDRQMENDDGVYQKSLGKYLGIIQKITDDKTFVFFSQFFYWFRENETFNNRLNALISFEFDGLEAVYIARYVKLDDLPELSQRAIKKKNASGKDIIIGPIKPEKIEEIREVLSGKFDVRQTSYAYFLSVDGSKDSANSIIDEGPRIERLREHNRTFNRLAKVGTMVVFSLIWSMVAVDTSQGMGSTQMWLNLMSRLTAMIAGLTSGWLTAIQDVKLAAAELNIKTKVINIFCIDLADKIFVPKTYEEMEEERFAEQEKREEEARKSVLDPEVVKGVQEAPLQIEAKEAL
jgi:hypothetical protein